MRCGTQLRARHSSKEIFIRSSCRVCRISRSVVVCLSPSLKLLSVSRHISLFSLYQTWLKSSAPIPQLNFAHSRSQHHHISCYKSHQLNDSAADACYLSSYMSVASAGGFPKTSTAILHFVSPTRSPIGDRVQTRKRARACKQARNSLLVLHVHKHVIYLSQQLTIMTTCSLVHMRICIGAAKKQKRTKSGGVS